MGDSHNWMKRDIASVSARTLKENDHVLEPPLPLVRMQTSTPAAEEDENEASIALKKRKMLPNSVDSIKQYTHANSPRPREEMIIAKFDSFVRSLDNIFPQPSCLNNNPSFLFQQPTSPSIDLVDARKRLCSLLPIHLHILADSSKLTELVHLSTKLQKHTSLNSDQLSMLKMVIEEVPHLSEQTLKVKELVDQVETFVASLQSNLTKATLMLKQYNDTKKAVSNLQGGMYANAYAMRETDDQIRRLRIRRSELVRIGEMKKNAMEELDSYLKKKKQDLRNIAEEIKGSNATKRELEVRKQSSTHHCKEIIARLAPLKSFRIE